VYGTRRRFKAALELLLEAAGFVLNRVSRWSALKAWGTRLVKKIGDKKATIADFVAALIPKIRTTVPLTLGGLHFRHHDAVALPTAERI